MIQHDVASATGGEHEKECRSSSRVHRPAAEVMQVIYSRCCGLDVHKASVTACVITIDARGKRTVRKKEFRTFDLDLNRLILWLMACKVTHVAMESTGVYCKPVWKKLEGKFELILTNPSHMKAIPGRKTDQLDAEWIADLLGHGLLRASFVPPPDPSVE